MRKLVATFRAWFSNKPEETSYVKLDNDELHVILHFGPELITHTFHLRNFAACVGLCEKGLLMMEEDKVSEMTLSLTQQGADWLRHYYREKRYERYDGSATD